MLLPIKHTGDGSAAVVHMPPGGYTKHLWVPAEKFKETYDALAQSGKLDNCNLHYSPATFTGTLTPYHGRRNDQVLSASALWLDIDAGAEKFAKHGDSVYPTQLDALHALKKFCDDSGMPPPAIVDSGAGLHVYWPLSQPLAPVLWQKLASRLAWLVAHHKLRVDTARTETISTTLRLPGSLHPNGRRVTVLRHAKPDDAALLAALKKATPVEKTAPAEPGDYPKYQVINVLRKAKEGTGCKQMQHVMQTRGNVVEPLWRAGLSIVEHASEDAATKEILLRKLSEGHPAFSRKETETKAAATKGPYNCETFSKINPAACANCKLRGYIKTPIATGYTAGFSADEHRAHTAPTPDPLPQADSLPANRSFTQPPSDLGATEKATESLPPARVFVLEEPPERSGAPFKDGCEQLIYKIGSRNALYVSGMWGIAEDAKDFNEAYFLQNENPRVGVTLLTRAVDEKGVVTFASTPILSGTLRVVGATNSKSGSTNTGVHCTLDVGDGLPLKRFTIETSMYVAGSRGENLASLLSSMGCQYLNFTTGHKDVSMYLASVADEITKKRMAAVQIDRFGWSEDGKSFVLGTHEYCTDRKHRIVAASKLGARTQGIGAVAGTIEQWNDVLRKMYAAGTPADLPMQFAMLAGFGAPLHALSNNERGGVIHLFSAASGAGKSTVQKAITAIYENPTITPTAFMLSNKSDTLNARFEKLGVLNSLPLLCDEITELNPEQVINFVYSSTQGSAKDRLDSNSKLRNNTTSWGAYAITSANKRISDVVANRQRESEGVDKRVLEMAIPVMRNTRSLLEDQQIVSPIVDGKVHGVAGHAWVQYLVENKEAVLAVKAQILQELSRKASLSRQDRFLVNMVSSALAAGLVCAKLGLHPFPIKPIVEYAVTLLNTAKAATSRAADTSRGLVREFINANVGRMARLDASGNPVLSIANVINGGYAGATCPETGLLFIAEAHLRDYCKQHGAGPTESAVALNRLGRSGYQQLSPDRTLPPVLGYFLDTKNQAVHEFLHA